MLKNLCAFKGVDNLGSQSADTSGRVREMEIALEDIQEKIWELDKSWKNNLVGCADHKI